jgi:hypothetical protein
MKEDGLNDSLDEFDKWLALPGVRRSGTLVDSATDVRDTLRGAWHAVRSVFGEKATPEHALSVLPEMLRERELARRRFAAELGSRTQDDEAS